MLLSGSLGVYKGDHDIACALSGGQPLVVVCQTPRMHQQPAQARLGHTAVVADKPRTSTLQAWDNSVREGSYMDVEFMLIIAT